MTPAMSQKLMSYGVWTYRGSWMLEITAAIIGVSTGVALGYQAVSTAEAGSVNSMDLVLQSAPFFMVGLAELMKIPIATLLFSAKWIWKPLLLVFLLALAAITFETVFFGLERALTLRQLKYEELTKHISVLESESKNIKDADEQLQQATDQVEKASAEINGLTELSDKEKASIQADIDKVKHELEAGTQITPEAAGLLDSIKEKEVRRSSLIAERDKQVSDAVASFERQRDSYVERINAARSNNDIQSAKKWEDELSKLPNPKGAIFAQYAKQIQTLDDDLASLNGKYDQAKLQGQPIAEEEKAKLTARLSKLQEQYDNSSKNWDAQLDAARNRLSAARDQASNRDQIVAKNKSRQDEISKELSDTEAKRITEARLNQVRRIASRIYGTKPEAVTDEQAGLVANLWFGSLAFLAALAGPLSAMVALSLQKIASQPERAESGKLSKLVRKILLRWRWSRTRKVEVIKEVPVERIVEVEKIVEKPIETVVKEILYIPLLTDDVEIVRKALNENIPAEVANLMKMSVEAKEGKQSKSKSKSKDRANQDAGPA